MVQRNLLRQQLRQQRKDLSTAQQLIAANSVLAQLQTIPKFQSAKSVGAYLVNDGEIDPIQIIECAWQQNKTVSLPKIKPNNDMIFVEYKPDSALEKNQYGILEPSTDNTIENIDVILVPLVGFDSQGNRLGMGGGYYDRYLAKLKEKPFLIGLAHHCQQVETLEVNSWDIPLNMIITDNDIIDC